MRPICATARDRHAPSPGLSIHWSTADSRPRYRCRTIDRSDGERYSGPASDDRGRNRRGFRTHVSITIPVVLNAPATLLCSVAPISGWRWLREIDYMGLIAASTATDGKFARLGWREDLRAGLPRLRWCPRRAGPGGAPCVGAVANAVLVSAATECGDAGGAPREFGCVNIALSLLRCAYCWPGREALHAEIGEFQTAFRVGRHPRPPVLQRRVTRAQRRRRSRTPAAGRRAPPSVACTSGEV